MKTLVVSRYNESVYWVDKIKNIDEVIIYNKGQRLNLHRDLEKKLPNIGREAHTICHHIVENWDNLSDYIYFCQGYPFSHCLDFMKRFVVYNKPTPLSTRYSKFWPTKEITDKDLVYYYKDLEIRMGNVLYFGHRSFDETYEWFDDVWSSVFDCSRPKIYYYGYAAQWFVRKEDIYFRGLRFWEQLLEKLSKPFKAPYTQLIDPWSMEALWNAVFNPAYQHKCTIT